MAGQTLSQIRALLTEAGLTPRQRLGQNFLIDLNLMRKLVQLAKVGPDDVVLEVGCGTGSLTELLLETGAAVVGVEIDRGLFELLSRRLGEHPRLKLLNTDVLADKHHVAPAVLEALRQTPCGPHGVRKLVANLPYQVATPLLLDLLRAEPRLERLTCTIQKEVAQRLAASPGSKIYGPASVTCQSLAAIELHAELPPSVFWPRPKVDSVVLTLAPWPPERIDIADVDDFERFVMRGFSQRRKTLRRILRGWKLEGIDYLLTELGLTSRQRPEELTPEQWRRFHRAVLLAQQERRA